MALTQPVLYSQAAFDATQEHIFPFNVVGGDQVVANILTIKNNTTNTQVYSEREVTFVLSHTLPANTLTNGVYYSATLKTENSLGENSTASVPIQFYCYSAPTFAFSNLINGSNLTTSSYNFEISYSQSEGEALEQYTFNLYDYSSNLIATSGTLYTNSSSSTFSSQYTFTGFTNNTSYYIECVGVTAQGTQITTGLILFGVNYNASSSKLNLVNNCLGGYIYISSNPIAIFGFSYPSPPTYVTYGEETYVNLSQNGSYVFWDNGFSTSTTDWTLSLWGRNFNNNQEICILKNSNTNNLISMEYIVENSNCYIKLLAKDNNFNYCIYSNTISIPSSTDNLMIWVRMVNDIYDIVLTNLEE